MIAFTPPLSIRLAACSLVALVAAISLRAADPAIINLWPEGVPGLRADAGPEKEIADGRVSAINHPSLTVFAPAAGSANGTAVVICPGGSYVRLAFDHEGLVPGRWFAQRGVWAFVLKYRLKEYGHPAPLRDVLRAIRLIRSRAGEFGIRPDRIGVLGFSAGGHLAASAGTLFDAPEGRTGAALDSVSARPDFMILVYPVITMEPPYAHQASRIALLGAAPAPGLVSHLSLERQVSAGTPPAFMVQTEEDKTVPMENSILLYEALRRSGVPAELHLYAVGKHGFGMRPGMGPTSEWPDRLEDWMRFHGWLPARVPAVKPVSVVLETDLGAFTVEVDLARAPITGANFLGYVDRGFFDGGVFDRSVRPDNTRRHDVEIQVIQAEENPALSPKLLPPIPLERTSVTGLRHIDGVISMSRDKPDTAQAAFFITIGSQPELDFGGRRNPDGQGFAAFGRVVDGMDVIRRIQAAHTATAGVFGTETLSPAIRIVKAHRKIP